MKLEVGMYVRTKYGDVFILDKIEDNCLIPRYVYIPCIIIKEDVKKASHEIIDLIEVGDYVNGSKVEEIHNGINGNRVQVVTTECYVGQENGEYDVVPAKDIKSIVTKESFSQMEYKID